ncbi:GNAT family N-acetyltransferase [Deinococcus hopiensis]|uniref:Protein N-acetyltransferase, RimJ/RimL family n=1 Tax=Deinococcus hopiensis KR-140 TaxID=695939 RepID=A0A1W1VBI8_9DEIO|nr:GNAT family N-acetyltransferase [Deinococcus hopiensis]SMB90593.1 Protein N-acetyltransferase, RimJ/RimL family [Deinococcus hopiensis KR-140]
MITQLTLREATPDDLPFMLSLAPRLTATAPAWRDQAEMTAGYEGLFTGAIHEPEEGSAVLIAQNPEGQPVGFTLLYWDPKARSAFIKDLAVSERAEGLGVGQFLMQSIEQWAKDKGAVEIMLKTSWYNTRARSFYERAGFQEDHIALVRRLD